MNADLWLIFASLFLWSLGLGSYTFTWPLYVQSLGATPVEVGFLQSIIFVGSMVSYLPGGVLADRYERRIQMIIGWAMTIPVPLMYAYAHDWRGMIPAGLLWGLSSFNGPTISAYVTDTTEAKRLASTMTLVWASIPLGTAISPVIGGYIAERAGMRSVFWLAFVLYVLSTALLFFVRKNWPSHRLLSESRPDTARLSTWAVARRVFTPAFVVACAVFTMAQVAINLQLPFFGPYLKESLGLDLVWIGILGSVTAAGGALLSPLLGRVADRTGTAIGVAVGLVLLGASSLLLISGWGLATVVFAAGLRGIVEGLRGIMSASIGRRADRKYVGTALGTYYLVVGVGIAAAPTLAGLLYAARREGPYLATAVIAVALAGLCLIDGLRRILGERAGHGLQASEQSSWKSS